MKKLLLFVMMLFLVCGCSKNSNELVMVTEAEFAPYEYYKDGEIVGVDVDIAKEIAKELGKKLVIKDIAFDSIVNEVKTGKADFGAAGISYSPERAENVDFSNDYSVSRQVAVVRENTYKSVSEIMSKRIAVQLGSIGDTYVSEHFKDASVVRQKKYLAAAEDLKASKVDAIVMDELPAKQIILNNTGLVILDEEITSDSYGMIVKEAVIDAIYNAKINKQDNKYMLGSAEVISKINDKIDTIIIDPPRVGLNKKTLDFLVNYKSRNLIYMSCNPFTLVRDLSILKDIYEVNDVYYLDMFPKTKHMECLCVLKLK